MFQTPIYGEEIPYFDSFSANKDAYKHSCSTLHGLLEFIFYSGQEIFSFAFVLPDKRLNRDLKNNCDFDTAILHYVDSDGRKYILRIGLRCFANQPKTAYIFFQLAEIHNRPGQNAP